MNPDESLTPAPGYKPCIRCARGLAFDEPVCPHCGRDRFNKESNTTPSCDDAHVAPGSSLFSDPSKLKPFPATPVHVPTPGEAPDTSVAGTIENFRGMAKVAACFNDIEGAGKEYLARADAIVAMQRELAEARAKLQKHGLT